MEKKKMKLQNQGKGKENQSFEDLNGVFNYCLTLLSLASQRFEGKK